MAGRTDPGDPVDPGDPGDPGKDEQQAATSPPSDASAGGQRSPHASLRFQEIENSPTGRRITASGYRLGRNEVGLLLFAGVCVLAVIFFAALALLTWATRPDPEAIAAFLPHATDAELAQTLADQQAAWLQQTTTLGQLAVFGGLIPMLSTIIGYVLGREGSGS